MDSLQGQLLWRCLPLGATLFTTAWARLEISNVLDPSGCDVGTALLLHQHLVCYACTCAVSGHVSYK